MAICFHNHLGSWMIFVHQHFNLPYLSVTRYTFITNSLQPKLITEFEICVVLYFLRIFFLWNCQPGQLFRSFWVLEKQADQRTLSHYPQKRLRYLDMVKYRRSKRQNNPMKMVQRSYIYAYILHYTP